jgi:hypothetical protein
VSRSISRRQVLLAAPVAAAVAASRCARPESPEATAEKTDTSRVAWVAQATRMARPVIEALAANSLSTRLPAYPPRNREYAPLEAFGRLIAGIAPWIEQDRPQPWLDLIHQALDHASDPKSPDFMNWRGRPDRGPQQPLVDAAYVALGLLRAPESLWKPLPPGVKAQLLNALRSTRQIPPNPTNNWTLFPSTIEAALYRLGGDEVVRPRVQDAIDKLSRWYVGDGTYADGEHFHWDHYNSYVMHSMLLATVEHVAPVNPAWAALLPETLERARRYAAVQEQMISPEGTYSVVGRSSVYRTAAFQTLADIALRKQLPEGIPPAQARCAMSAVIHRVLDFPGTYDTNGWLSLGVCGKQPGLEDEYNSAGSAYMASLIFLPLGLPATDTFWTGADMPWTQVKIWSGADVRASHARD